MIFDEMTPIFLTLYFDKKGAKAFLLAHPGSERDRGPQKWSKWFGSYERAPSLDVKCTQVLYL